MQKNVLVLYIVGVPIKEITLILENLNRENFYQMNSDWQG